MTALDPRLHAFRSDLADAGLRGQVASSRFVEPRAMQVIEPVIAVRKSPRMDAVQLTQALIGETVKVFDEAEGWAWVQLDRDDYVGYVTANALDTNIVSPTHRVAVPSTFLYPEPNLKTQPAIAVTFNAQVNITGYSGNFSLLSNGRYVYSSHLQPVESRETDFVAIAEMFRHVPYYWGGKSVFGLDCSGLVQLALEACGVPAGRDSDMQEKGLGEAVLANDLDSLKRGDLVFWDGHVGIMCDSNRLLHANGHHMMVVEEPLQAAVERIALRYGQITSIKRF